MVPHGGGKVRDFEEYRVRESVEKQCVDSNENQRLYGA